MGEFGTKSEIRLRSTSTNGTQSERKVRKYSGIMWESQRQGKSAERNSWGK
jgi:hypothetical protein